MRKILMSKPGEFAVEMKTDFLRGAAVKKLAGMINRRPQETNEQPLVINSIGTLKSSLKTRK